MLERIDHLVFATPDLADGVAYIEQLLGVDATPGGNHPDFGTRNALVSLGEHTYLEIVGPDLERLDPSPPSLFRLREVDRPQLVTWAAKGVNLDAIVDTAGRAGMDLGFVSRGSRLRLDGTLLEWSLTDPYTNRLGGIIPFFIDWADTPHPALSLPRTCQLENLAFSHPDVSEARSTFASVGMSIHVHEAAKPSIVATVATPNGVVEIT